MMTAIDLNWGNDYILLFITKNDLVLFVHLFLFFLSTLTDKLKYNYRYLLKSCWHFVTVAMTRKLWDSNLATSLCCASSKSTRSSQELQFLNRSPNVRYFENQVASAIGENVGAITSTSDSMTSFYFQEVLMKRLGPNAHLVNLKLNHAVPASVRLLPAKEYRGAAIGINYDLRIYAGKVYE